jgi:hypothetical protein
MLSAAKLLIGIDNWKFAVKSTSAVDLFVPEQVRCGHAGYRELVQGDDLL